MHNRIRNYYFIRDKVGNELEWLRPSSLPPLPQPLIIVDSTYDPLTTGEMRAIFEARALAGPDGTVVAILRNYPSPFLLTPIERAVQLTYMPVNYLIEADTPADFSSILALLSPTRWVTTPTTSYPSIPKAFVRPPSLSTPILLSRAYTLLSSSSTEISNDTTR